MNELNQRYLSKEMILPKKINILKSLCGTGKTTAICEYLLDLPEDTRIICVTFRKSLCSFLTKNLPNLRSYLECKTKYISCDENPRVAISAESFWRYKNKDRSVPMPKVYIIDEFCSFMEHLVNTTTLNGVQRNYFIEMTGLFLRCPDVTVILCDAYFTTMDYEIVEMLAEGTDRINYVFNRYCEIKTRIILYTNETRWKKAFFKNAMDLDQKLYVFSNCKKTLEGLDQEYHNMKYPGADPFSYSNNAENDRRILICSDSSNEEKELYSSQPDESWSENRILYTSPTIQAGVSFMKEHFTKAFGYAISSSTSVLAFLQQMARARNLSEKEVHIILPRDMKKVPKFFKKEETNPDNVRGNLVRYSEWTNARITDLVEKKLIVDKGRVVESVTNHSILNEILIRYLVNRSKQKISYTKEFQEYIQNDWYELAYENELDDHGFKYMPSIMTTMEEANINKNKFWLQKDWSGEWDFEQLPEGGIQSEFVEFANEWNIFGALGRLDTLDKPFFVKESLAKFVPKYVNKDAQDNFHRFFVKGYTEILEQDADEGRYNSYSFDTILYSGMAAVFHAYKIFPSDATRIVFPGRLPFYSSTIHIPVPDIPLEIEANEEFLNESSRFTRLCEELDKSYSWIVKKLDLKLISEVHPDWLINRCLDQKATTELRKILDAMLKFIGLERTKKPKSACKKKSFSTQKSARMNFRVYGIKKFRIRLMISVCKMFKNVPLGVEHPNYPTVDPFSLLNWDKVPKKESQIEEVDMFKPPSQPRIRVLRDPNRVTIVREVSELQKVYKDPFTEGLRFWPLKKELMSLEWFNQMRRSWGVMMNQYNSMTSLDNVFDRFDYWNPKSIKEKYFDHLPDFYTMIEYRMKSITEKRPLREMPDKPIKRRKMFEPDFEANCDFPIL